MRQKSLSLTMSFLLLVGLIAGLMTTVVSAQVGADHQPTDEQVEGSDRRPAETEDTEALVEPGETVADEEGVRPETATERLERIRSQNQIEHQERVAVYREQAAERLEGARDRAAEKRAQAQEQGEEMRSATRERLRENLQSRMEQFFVRYRVAVEDRLFRIANRLESRIEQLEAEEEEITEARQALETAYRKLAEVSALIDQAETEMEERLETFEHPSELRAIIGGGQEELQTDIREAHGLLIDTVLAIREGLGEEPAIE